MYTSPPNKEWGGTLWPHHSEDCLEALFRSWCDTWLHPPGHVLDMIPTYWPFIDYIRHIREAFEDFTDRNDILKCLIV